MRRHSIPLALIVAAVTTLPATSAAQGTTADYQRADTVAERTDGLVLDVPEAPHWLAGNRFWYRKSVKGGNVFVLVDAASAEKRPAFDHDRIAAALGAAAQHTYTGVTLPFRTFTFVDNDRAIDVTVDNFVWRCSLAAGPSTPPGAGCSRQGPAEDDGRAGRGGGRGAGPVEEGGGRGNIAQRFFGGGYYGDEGRRESDGKPRVSPDGKMEAFIRDYNIWTRPAGSSEATALSLDRSEERRVGKECVSRWA